MNINEKVYETDRLILKYFSREDITDRYRSWFHDPEVTRWNSHGLFPYTKEQSEKFLAALDGDRETIIFAIYEKYEIIFGDSPKSLPLHSTRSRDMDDPKSWEDPLKIRHIGNISLQRINYINRSAEMAWVLGEKDAWGRGYATEAGQLLIDHAFNRLNLHRLWTGVVWENEGMKKVCEKLGFRYEGTMKESVFLGGSYRNIVMYGRLRDHD